MASDDEDHNATVYGEEDLDEEEDESEEDRVLHNQQGDEEEDVDLVDDEEDDEEEEEDYSTSSAAGEVTIAVSGVPNIASTVSVTPTTATTTNAGSIVRSDAIMEVKRPVDDSRRLFQRLWTDEDEIELLQGFLEYTIQRGTNGSSHHHHDTAAFYDQIKGRLQLDFNKNQLVEKIRRLKKKYRNVLAKISSGKESVFKSSHDQSTFDLSCKIWGDGSAATASGPVVDAVGMDDEEPYNPNSTFNLNDHNGNGIADPNSSEKKVPRPRKRSRSTAVKIEENYNLQQPYGQSVGTGASNLNPVMNSVTPNLVEETVKSCLLPLFKELVNNSSNGASNSSRGLGLGFGGMNVNTFGGSMNFPNGDMSDEKWRKQNILELEVYSKRLELMQDQVKSWLEELRSMGN